MTLSVTRNIATVGLDTCSILRYPTLFFWVQNPNYMPSLASSYEEIIKQFNSKDSFFSDVVCNYKYSSSAERLAFLKRRVDYFICLLKYSITTLLIQKLQDTKKIKSNFKWAEIEQNAFVYLVNVKNKRGTICFSNSLLNISSFQTKDV